MDDPAWPSSPSLHRMLYWGDSPGKRPHDHVRRDVSEVHRQSIVFVLKNGQDAHPEIQANGWANCRICGTNLGSRDLTAFGFVWPEKADHYLLEHGVWTPECDQLLRQVLAAPS